MINKIVAFFKKLKYFFAGGLKVSETTTMSMTPNNDIFIRREYVPVEDGAFGPYETIARDDYDYHQRREMEIEYDYYKMIEDPAYFCDRSLLKDFGAFRMHGKYASTFHPGRKLPNEYYCPPSEGMTLRSGKKLNCISGSFLYNHGMDLTQNWYRQFNNPEERCFQVKKAIWFWENYYHVLSQNYTMDGLYSMSLTKINEFISQIEKSSPAVYMERNFEIYTDEDGYDCYNVDFLAPMPERPPSETGYVFCNCNYTVIKNGQRAIDQCGHHMDEFLLKLKDLKKKYSRPHRKTINEKMKARRSLILLGNKTIEDCAREIFSFLPEAKILGL